MRDLEDEVQNCDRCGVLHLVQDFKGEVCGWCADDLARIEGINT